MKKTLLRNSFCTALIGAGLMLARDTKAEYPTNVVSQILTGTNNWYHTNTYMLNGAVFVMSNAVLNIEAGTVIKGHNLGGQGTNVAALYITRGAKIYAEGTPQNPIIVTGDVDDTTIPDDINIYARGLWGGLVIFGNSVLNGAIDAAVDWEPHLSRMMEFPKAKLLKPEELLSDSTPYRLIKIPYNSSPIKWFEQVLEKVEAK